MVNTDNPNLLTYMHFTKLDTYYFTFVSIRPLKRVRKTETKQTIGGKQNKHYLVNRSMEKERKFMSPAHLKPLTHKFDWIYYTLKVEKTPK